MLFASISKYLKLVFDLLKMEVEKGVLIIINFKATMFFDEFEGNYLLYKSQQKEINYKMLSTTHVQAHLLI